MTERSSHEWVIGTGKCRTFTLRVTIMLTVIYRMVDVCVLVESSLSDTALKGLNAELGGIGAVWS